MCVPASFSVLISVRGFFRSGFSDLLQRINVREKSRFSNACILIREFGVYSENESREMLFRQLFLTL